MITTGPLHLPDPNKTISRCLCNKPQGENSSSNLKHLNIILSHEVGHFKFVHNLTIFFSNLLNQSLPNI